MAAHGAEHDVQVYVGEQLDSRASILRAVLRGGGVALAVALPVLLVAALVGRARRHHAVAPAGHAAVAAAAAGLQPLSLDGAPSEVRPLLLALNGLFERIAALLEAERRFTADAAHELRTPIAAIRTQAQVALGESDDGLRAHALRATLEGCDRATRLVEQLLTLARLEADQELVRSQVDLSALARRVAADLAPAALAKRQQLELGAEQPLVLSGNETLLAVLLRNLLDNAVRYSPAGARVKLVVDARGLQVHDSGPGMAPEDLARLGERFFRPPGQQASGSGLGWSIVRRIAAVHGLRVQVQRSAELGGLRVDLQV
jgi:two-component system sensor histidine kinase QseC